MQQQSNKNLSTLSRVLSDTFILYMKTYAVHWNYTGGNFFSIHKMTEAQYAELAEAIDEIAERVRALGHETPISLDDILDGGDLKEIKSGKIASSAMLEELAKGHELLAKRAHEAAEAADEAKDYFSHDMMVARIGAHQKAAWMMKSLLKN